MQTKALKIIHQVIAPRDCGKELVHLFGVSLALDEELLSQVKQAAAEAGGSVRVTNDVNEGFVDAEVVYAKSWGSKRFYGSPEEELAARSPYRKDWIVDEEKMARTKQGIFMHCLPVRRNVIVTDAVIDSPASVVIDEAENRLHVQKAILKELMSR